MTPDLFLDLALIPALRLLPARMDTPAARAMVLSIALQESRLMFRRQLQYGPARGFAQFERAGVAGVLRHEASATHIRQVLATLCYGSLLTAERTRQINACHAAIEHNDVLACVFARLLLWTLPQPLPDRHDPEAGWQQYLSAWRPGKPHRDTWDDFYAAAWDTTTKEAVP